MRLAALTLVGSVCCVAARDYDTDRGEFLPAAKFPSDLRDNAPQDTVSLLFHSNSSEPSDRPANEWMNHMEWGLKRLQKELRKMRHQIAAEDQGAETDSGSSPAPAESNGPAPMAAPPPAPSPSDEGSSGADVVSPAPAPAPAPPSAPAVSGSELSSAPASDAVSPTELPSEPASGPMLSDAGMERAREVVLHKPARDFPTPPPLHSLPNLKEASPSDYPMPPYYEDVDTWNVRNVLGNAWDIPLTPPAGMVESAGTQALH